MRGRPQLPPTEALAAAGAAEPPLARRACPAAAGAAACPAPAAAGAAAAAAPAHQPVAGRAAATECDPTCRPRATPARSQDLDLDPGTASTRYLRMPHTEDARQASKTSYPPTVHIDRWRVTIVTGKRSNRLLAGNYSYHDFGKSPSLCGPARPFGNLYLFM